jgi:thioredoxin 1
MLLELTDVTFREQVTGTGGPCVVLFSSPWCGVCAKVAPRLQALSDQYAHVTFGKVDVSASAGIATELGVLSIPALLFFKGGVEKYRAAGNISVQEIAQKIQDIL